MAINVLLNENHQILNGSSFSFETLFEGFRLLVSFSVSALKMMRKK